MMATRPLTLVPPAGGSVPVCVHRWSRLPGSVGLFQCARCAERGVCPGCLNSLNVALVAADAGFAVIWCEAHTTLGSVPDEN